MNRHKIVISEPAEADIDAIRFRLMSHSPDAAVRFQNGIENVIDSLSQMPKRCAVAQDNDRLEHPSRQLIYRSGAASYRILFAVFDEQDDIPCFVRILRIRHGSQQSLLAPADEE